MTEETKLSPTTGALESARRTLFRIALIADKGSAVRLLAEAELGAIDRTLEALSRPSPIAEPQDKLEICDACCGSGVGVADTVCSKCDGSGGVPAEPQEDLS